MAVDFSSAPCIAVLCSIFIGLSSILLGSWQVGLHASNKERDEYQLGAIALCMGIVMSILAVCILKFVE
jgi:hypothetical protein